MAKIKEFFAKVVAWVKTHKWQSISIGAALVVAIVVAIVVPVTVSKGKKNKSGGETNTLEPIYDFSKLDDTQKKEVFGYNAEHATYTCTLDDMKGFDVQYPSLQSGGEYITTLIKDGKKWELDKKEFALSRGKVEEADIYLEENMGLPPHTSIEYFTIGVYEGAELETDGVTFRSYQLNEEMPEYFIYNDGDLSSTKYEYKGMLYSTSVHFGATPFDETFIEYLHLTMMYADKFSYNESTKRYEMDRDYLNNQILTAPKEVDGVFYFTTENGKVNHVYFSYAKKDPGDSFMTVDLEVKYEETNVNLPTIIDNCKHLHTNLVQREFPEDSGVFYHYYECEDCGNDAQIKQCTFDEKGECTECHNSPKKTLFINDSNNFVVAMVHYNAITKAIMDVSLNSWDEYPLSTEAGCNYEDYPEIVDESMISNKKAVIKNGIITCLFKCERHDSTVFYLLVVDCQVENEMGKDTYSGGTSYVFNVGGALPENI